MGTLANSLFQAMLGWIRTLSSQIWTTATASESTTLLAWIGAHWKGLALALCAAGMIADLVIYLIRWQPQRAWGSFFRRLRHRGEEEEDSVDAAYPDASFSDDMASGYAYASPDPYVPAPDGREYTEERPGGFPENTYRQNDRRWEMPDEVYEEYTPEEESYATDEASENDAVFAQDDMSASADGFIRSRNMPIGTTAAFDQALRPRKRRRVTGLLREQQEETVKPDELIDQYAAYRRPVYPRSWQADEGDEG